MSFETDQLLPEPRLPADAALSTFIRMRRGFFMLSIASEVYSVVSLGLFLPVTLEQFARVNGYNAPDHTQRCIEQPSDSPPPEGQDGMRCAVKLFGLFWIDSASFSLVVYSVSVALQALVVISIGRTADNPQERHRLLVLFCTLGSLLTMAFFLLPADSWLWPLSGLFAAGGNVSFGCVMVLLNSFLTEIRTNAPSVRAALADVLEAEAALVTARERARNTGDRHEVELRQEQLSSAHATYDHERESISGRTSARAIASGYASGIVCLALLLIPIVQAHSSPQSLRFAIGASGLYWGLASIPAIFWLRPMHLLSPPKSSTITGLEAVKQSWRGLGQMIREYKRLPVTFLYLACWFLLSDAFATMTSSAVLFAKTTLNMDTPSLIGLGIIAPAAGMVGALAIPELQHRYLRFSNATTLVALVCLALTIPVYGLVLLRTPAEMFAVAVVFGIFMGGFQGYARVVFSELIPASQSARWFALYSITDKSSSFLGPLLVALITDRTGNLRYGFLLIGFMMGAALPMLRYVDTARGRADAEHYDTQSRQEAAQMM